MADNKPMNKSDYRNMPPSKRGQIKQDRSPYNPDNSLFKRLTKLFSGPIVNRRQQNYKSERRRRLDKYKFQSAQGQEFKKSSYILDIIISSDTNCFAKFSYFLVKLSTKNIISEKLSRRL